jgi:hypothetical protein
MRGEDTMPGEKTDSAAGARLDVGEAIRLARDNGYFREMLEDARSDPIAMQSIWVAAKGPRANNNRTFSQAKPDAAMNYLLKEIDVHDGLASGVMGRWLSLVCDSWPHTENFLADIGWKPYFALHLLGGGLGIDQGLYPSADLFRAGPQDDGAMDVARFADRHGRTLDLCVAKRILLRFQANVWQKFRETDSRLKKSGIDFSSPAGADLGLFNGLLVDVLSVMGFVHENRPRILDVMSLVDADFHGKCAGLPNANFAVSLFAGHGELVRKIDAGLDKIVLDAVL